jgi:hypothetical protein
MRTVTTDAAYTEPTAFEQLEAAAGAAVEQHGAGDARGEAGRGHGLRQPGHAMEQRP